MTIKNTEHLDTPALLLDLDRMERNLLDVNAFAKEHKVQWRPHIKTHKCIEIAKRQIEMGACGITVAKLSEAEIMVKAGINDILIAFPLSSHQKLERLLSLLQMAKVIIAVDSVEQVEMLQTFFEYKLDNPLEVWIKLNSGLNRCGVEPGEEVVHLARAITSTSTLSLKGIFTHAGHSYAATTPEQIYEIGVYEGKSVVDSATLCEEAGIPIDVKSVGSTPTYKTAGSIPGITEIRPGNAVFFDAIQAGLGVTTFNNCALSVLATVSSVKHNRLILDTGSKALSLDQGAHGNSTVRGFGHILQHPDHVIERLSEEHGIVTFPEVTALKLTDRVEIIPNHACTVANLFDTFIVHRNNKIIDQWTVDARGCMQ